jgi:hypothetical protein
MAMTIHPPFHLAIAVKNLEESRFFYGQILGASEGRSDDTWVDFNFFGHQLVAHLIKTGNWAPNTNSHSVDGDQVPVPHFGVILEENDWQKLVEQLQSHKWPFEISPKLKFPNTVGEQQTVFVRDPSGNTLEFKSFKNIEQLFATD